MPIKTGYWIQVKNGQVLNVWDYKPSADKLAAELGWREAVEIIPDIIPNREIITTHHFNIDTDPAQIIWGKRLVEVSERKDSLRGLVKNTFTEIVNAELFKQIDNYPETQYNADIVEAARIVFETHINDINAIETHEDADTIMDKLR